MPASIAAEPLAHRSPNQGWGRGSAWKYCVALGPGARCAAGHAGAPGRSRAWSLLAPCTPSLSASERDAGAGTRRYHDSWWTAVDADQAGRRAAVRRRRCAGPAGSGRSAAGSRGRPRTRRGRRAEPAPACARAGSSAAATSAAAAIDTSAQSTTVGLCRFADRPPWPRLTREIALMLIGLAVPALRACAAAPSAWAPRAGAASATTAWSRPPGGRARSTCASRSQWPGLLRVIAIGRSPGSAG